MKKRFWGVLTLKFVLTSAMSLAGSWTMVPGGATGSSFINGLASVKNGDIWGVGATGRTATNPLTERWNGTQWTVVPTPTLPNGGQFLAVAARTPKDIWTVGETGSLFGSFDTLVEHWDGTSWSVVASPTFGENDSHLKGVCAISRDDAWAVGASFVGGFYILIHWDGTNWSVADAPPVSNGALLSLKAFASDDVWAVGYKDFDYNANSSSTFTLHWDGKAWSENPSPDPATANSLSGVDGIAPNDLWAVGKISNGGIETGNTLVLHWDGAAWTVIPTPVVSSIDFFAAVKAVSPTNVIAVGATAGDPLTERWNGTKWQVIPTPPVQDDYGLLLSIAAQNGSIWAAGYQGFRRPDDLFFVMTR